MAYGISTSAALSPSPPPPPPSQRILFLPPPHPSIWRQIWKSITLGFPQSVKEREEKGEKRKWKMEEQTKREERKVTRKRK